MALIIDEIQKAPILLEKLKKTIDSQRLIWLREGQERQLMYILSGSNRFELQQGISDSLAGRCTTIEMDSFSQVECHQQQAGPFNPSVEFLLEKSRKEKFPTALRHKSLKIFSWTQDCVPTFALANCQNAGGLRHERCIL